MRKTKNKKILSAILAASVLCGSAAVFTGCQNGSSDTTSRSQNDNSTEISNTEESSNDTESKESSETVSDKESTESSENEHTYVEYGTANIGDSGTCGENVTWELRENGELVISGSGNMYDYSEGSLYTGDNIKTVIIEKGVSSIGNNAFHGFADMTSITISNSVTSIGENAFYNCQGLTSINIPDSVTSIGNMAFYSCNKMKEAHISNSLTKIGDFIFDSCEELTSITIPDGVTSIGDMAFSNCDRLTSITIPDSVTSIGEYAFQNCPVLTSVTIPDSVTTIDSGAFEDCELLTNITIPDSVTNMGGLVFNNTLWYEKQPDGVVYAGKVAYGYKGDEPSDTNIVLKDDTVGIGGGAFKLETWITSMTIPESVKSIGLEAFENYITHIVMYVKSGSAAETYAKENNIPFVAE